MRRINKGLHQQRTKSVTRLNIVSQTPESRAQHPGAQMTTADHRADQKPAQADHRPVQGRRARRVAPADPPVAGGQPQGRGGKAQGPQHPMVRVDQIPLLHTRMNDRPAGMLAAHQFRPHAPVGLRGHRTHPPVRQIRHRRRNRHRVRHGHPQTARRMTASVRPGRRQDQMPRRLLRSQHGQTTGKAQTPPPVAQIKRLVHPTGHRVTTAGQRLYARPVSRGQQGRTKRFHQGHETEGHHPP